MAVYYEWDIETHDAKSGDVIDHNHASKLSEYSEIEIWQALTRFEDERAEVTRLVLVRDARTFIRNHSGAKVEVLNRTWCYVREDMTLPVACNGGDGTDDPESGYKVPARFHAELAAAIADAKESLDK